MARPAPHKLFLLAGQTALGIAFTVGAPPPMSVSATQPRWALHAWAALMLVAGGTGLVANLYRRWGLQIALLLELGSMQMGATGLLFYAVTLIGYAGWTRALSSAVILVAWASANAWRGVQIRRDLRELTK